MNNSLSEIRKLLQKKSDEKVKKSVLKLNPTATKVYGVKFPDLNKIAIEYKNSSFELVENLWNSGAFEEKILAAKILGKVCKENSQKTLELIERFSKKFQTGQFVTL